MRRLKLPGSATFFLTAALAGTALAQEPTDAEPGSLAVGADVATEGADVETTPDAAVPPPALDSMEAAESKRGRDVFEIGAYGGLMLLAGKTDAPPRSIADLPETEFGAVGFDFGARLGIYPIPYLGVEGEGGWVLTRSSNQVGANLGTGRVHLVGQYPTDGVTPFILVGGGVLGGQCPAGGCDGVANGREAEGQFHFGIGVKANLVDHVDARVDLRDNIAAGEHLPNLLLGLSYTFGGKLEAPPSPSDSDGDGLIDANDACPFEPASTPDGCPFKDRDGDGKADDVDRCPDEPSELPDGCPDRDSDRDGVLADADECPDVPGVPPNGCPDPDPDRDGVLGDADKCPKDPETKNGFEDADGCPDEVPDAVKKFTGVIQGIEFDFGLSTIRPASFKILDAAVELMQQYPSLRLRIGGHTDNVGTDEKNQELSRARAQAVADYLVGKGVAADRVESVGHGAGQPIADNTTLEGRQKNRRIEFAVIQ